MLKIWPMSRSTSTLAALLGSVLFLAGCSAGESTSATSSNNPSAANGSAGAANPDATLNIGFVLAPASLDFTQDGGAPIPQALLYNVYEGLVKLDANGKIVPLLAKSWTVSPDKKSYTFSLHPGVKFSSGAEFTADDVKFSIERVKTEWKPSVKAGMDVVSSVTVVDPTTVTVQLSRPSNGWLYAMAGRIGAMFSRTGVDALATKAVGTGPFTVRSYDPNAKLTLDRNDGYWGASPGVKTVALQYFKDPIALNNAQLAGTVDIVSTVQEPETLSQFSDTGKFQVIEGSTTGEVLLSFNHGKGPMADKTVRQAASYALDRQAILDTVWAGKGTLIGSHAVPTDPWYTDLSGRYPHDLGKAKELLAGKTPAIRLRVPSIPYATGSAPIIKSQLEQAGFRVTVDTLDFPDWLTQVYTNHDYDLSIVNHVEPFDLESIWGNPDYYPQYDNPEVQRLLTDADAAVDEQAWLDKHRRVTEILADDAAAIWLCAFPNVMVADANITGLSANQTSESFDLTTIGVK